MASSLPEAPGVTCLVGEALVLKYEGPHVLTLGTLPCYRTNSLPFDSIVGHSHNNNVLKTLAG